MGVKDPSACLTIDRDISEGNVLVIRNENVALVSREKRRRDNSKVEQQIRTGWTWPWIMSCEWRCLMAIAVWMIYDGLKQLEAVYRNGSLPTADGGHTNIV